MTLALGLLAVLLGADLVISGVTKRPLGRLVLGQWDSPGAQAAAATATATKGGGNAASGGVYAGQVARNTA